MKGDNTIEEFKLKERNSLLKDYLQLSKFTLNFTVVFSSVVCFLIAPYQNSGFTNTIEPVLKLFVFGFLVTASSNAINQILEKDTDALMARTAKRPVASGRISVQHASIFAWITGVVGVLGMCYFFNLKSGLLSLASLLVYAYIYTPLKRKNSIAVLVGAIPGALPCLIGWVAATDNFDLGGWLLFAIQFIWQFPHFWAIAWIAHEDYSKAGFKLLPSTEGPTRFSALQCIMYSVLLVPLGMAPYYFKLSGLTSFWVILACNMWMVCCSIMLFSKMRKFWARMVMFSSYFYLVIVLLTIYSNKVNVV